MPRPAIRVAARKLVHVVLNKLCSCPCVHTALRSDADMRHHRFLTTVVISAVSLAGAAPTVSAAGLRLIGQQSASGDFAIAFASGTASRPSAIYVRVIATPRQTVSVNWNMICSRGTGAGSKEGSYNTSDTGLRRLRMPTAHPDSCTVAAGGSLARGGRIKVLIYKR